VGLYSERKYCSITTKLTAHSFHGIVGFLFLTKACHWETQLSRPRLTSSEFLAIFHSLTSAKLILSINIGCSKKLCICEQQQL